MMALLYETVPAFEDTWIECLSDLGCYRMAIKDDDIRNREVWMGVTRHWYSKVSNKAPTTGRLYHHLAVLSAFLDHMLAFIYLASSMMALLYETVPTFEDTWIECLSGLGRYSMAIEDDYIRDREVWTGVARHWYSSIRQSPHDRQIAPPLGNPGMTEDAMPAHSTVSLRYCRN